MGLQYTLIGNEDGDSNIVVFVPGAAPQVAHSSHPNFDRILAGAIDGDTAVVELFDSAATVGQRFERLSERVTTKNGRLYLDGVQVDNALATQVLRFLDEGVDNWAPLVRFFENVQSNPQEHSREQLYTWLAARDFTITHDGLIVGYKGVAVQDGGYYSISQGKAIVNGEVYSGSIPNPLGAIVEMPRDEVTHDPSQGCHAGLHFGTYEYADSFARGALLEVLVNPRDVVSVPTDSGWAKARTCRYQVVGIIEQPYSSAVKPYDYDDAEAYDDDAEWGDDFDDFGSSVYDY